MITKERLEELIIQTRKEENDSIDIYYDIYIDNKKVGKIALSFYEDINSIGIGNFEIDKNERNKGYGTKVIKYIVDRYKDDYDLIYCYVDEDNTNAINLYNKLGKVYNELNDNNQYFVTFWDNKESLREDKARDLCVKLFIGEEV